MSDIINRLVFTNNYSREEIESLLKTHKIPKDSEVCFMEDEYFFKAPDDVIEEIENNYNRFVAKTGYTIYFNVS